MLLFLADLGKELWKPWNGGRPNTIAVLNGSIGKYWKQHCADRGVEAWRPYLRLCRTWVGTRISSANSLIPCAEDVLG
jgi:hypothetical protein